MMVQNILGSLLIAICGILRSTDLFFRTSVVTALPVVNIIMWEHIIGFVVLSPLLIYYRKYFKEISKLDFLFFVLVGFGASALGILFFTEAFKHINPALVVLLQKLQPIVTIIFGILILGERLTKRFYILAPIAILSSYFMSFSFTNPLSGEWNDTLKGVGFSLFAAFFWGSGTVWGKVLLKKYNKNYVLAMRYLFGMVFAIFLSFLLVKTASSELVLNLETGLLPKIVYMALIPGMVALFFFYFGLKKIKASLASIFELIFPIASVAIMWIFFGRPLDAVQLIAGAILLASMTILSFEK